jgi:hypothetical protein
MTSWRIHLKIGIAGCEPAPGLVEIASSRLREKMIHSSGNQDVRRTSPRAVYQQRHSPHEE